MQIVKVWAFPPTNEDDDNSSPYNHLSLPSIMSLQIFPTQSLQYVQSYVALVERKKITLKCTTEVQSLCQSSNTPHPWGSNAAAGAVTLTYDGQRYCQGSNVFHGRVILQRGS